MSVAYKPNSVVDSSLLLNLDFANSKRFSKTAGVTSFGAGNLIQDPTYNASTWGNVFSTNTTITTGIDAPDGSNNAVRVTCKTTGQSLIRIGFNSFTPASTSELYTVSFWVRKISGTVLESNQIWCGLSDTNPALDYSSQLVTGKWVRVSFSNTTTTTSKSFLDILDNNLNDYVLDFWGVKLELDDSSYVMPFKDSVGNYTMNLYHNQYASFDDKSVTFTRSATTRFGPAMNVTATGALTYGNFVYGNHTWEIWFKINDINPSSFDQYESMSNLMLYRGWHAGFYYSSSNLIYAHMNTGPTEPTVASWTLGTSGAQINQGNWYQVVVTKNGNVFTPYVNGVNFGTGTTTALTNPNVTTDVLYLGGMGNTTLRNEIYMFYPKCSISNVKMYNRALSAAEVLQNFNALRGRFGI
jgi:hypothetical protein